MSSRVRDIVHELVREDPKEHLEPVLRRTARAEKNLTLLKREIAEEVASSLGRAARRVQAHLDELERIDAQLSQALGAGDDQAAAGHRHRYNDVRKLAQDRLRDLRIQREALGLRRHDELAVHYPIPPRKRSP